jgi:hypothetical protein
MDKSLIEHFESTASTQVPVWVSAWEYGLKLLNKNNDIDWSDIGKVVSYHRQLQGLVNSEVITIQVDEFYKYYQANTGSLKNSMKEKRRLGYPLRTLLAEPNAKKVLQEIVSALCDCYPNQPVVLELPSPKQWMALAYCYAHDYNHIEVSWEDAESASMYIADFLRTFSDCKLSAIMLKDVEFQGAGSDAQVAAYQPVINIAEHYRWQIVLDGCSHGYTPSPSTGITFSLGSVFSESSGVKLSEAQWKSNNVPDFSGNGFLFVEIPEDSVPEEVLEELTRLRKLER